MNENEDNRLKELLKKSKLETPSFNFTDRVMLDVQALAQENDQKKIWFWAWFNFILSVVMMPVATFLLVYLYQQFFEEQFEILNNTSGILQIGLGLMAAVVLLLQLDQLLRRKYSGKNNAMAKGSSLRMFF